MPYTYFVKSNKTLSRETASRFILLQKKVIPKNTNYLSEEFIEAAMAVRLVVLLLERALVQLFQAKRTYKMLRVEFAEHCCYAATCRKCEMQKKNINIILTILNFKNLVYLPVIGLWHPAHKDPLLA